MTVGTDLIVPEHLPPSEVLAKKWRNEVESGHPSLRDSARQLASQRTVVGTLVRRREGLQRNGLLAEYSPTFLGSSGYF